MSRREQRKLERLKKKKKRKARLKLAILIIAIGIFFSKNDIIKSQNIFIIQNKTILAKENEIEISNQETKEIISTTVTDNTEIVMPTVEEPNTEKNKNNANEVKKIVQKYIKDKNLTEKNFAFFYYEPETQKTYIYNGESYFTAASTIKVPLAMIYYD